MLCSKYLYICVCCGGVYYVKTSKLKSTNLMLRFYVHVVLSSNSPYDMIMSFILILMPPVLFEQSKTFIFCIEYNAVGFSYKLKS